jgi:UDP-glucose 4-epimerase
VIRSDEKESIDMQVAITGASGFLGRHVAARLARAGMPYRALGRSDLDRGDMSEILTGCDAVINCVGDKSGVGDAAERANVIIPQRLYQAAQQAGVKHFVHVSSVAAIASRTGPGQLLDDMASPTPDGPYGQSKLRGDESLRALADGRTILTILRPPILIANDAPGVFALFRRAAERGLSLPLAGAEGRRSFMHVDNFVEAILAAIRTGRGGTYIVADSAPLTSGELYARMLMAAGHPPRIFSIGKPGRWVLQRLLGRRGESLFGAAAFDGSRFAREVSPRWPVPPEEIVRAAMSGTAGPPTPTI